MKRLTNILILATIVAALAVCCCGCRDVYLSSAASAQLDITAAKANDSAVKARAGLLTEEQKTIALEGNATAWQKFRQLANPNLATTQPAN